MFFKQELKAYAIALKKYNTVRKEPLCVDRNGCTLVIVIALSSPKKKKKRNQTESFANTIRRS